MRVEDPVAEVVDRALVVDHQPDEVRRVEVQAEVRVGDRREHLVPDRRRPREVVAARPLVVAEDHRAVLDRDLHAALARVARRAAARSARKRSRFSGSGRSLSLPTNVPTVVDAERLRRVDHLAQVAVDLLALRVVGVEVVRVVGERRDREAVAVERRAHRVGVERVDVDVRDARVAAPLAAGGRPARDLERLEAVRGRPRGDLVEGRSRKAAVSRPSFTSSSPLP